MKQPKLFLCVLLIASYLSSFAQFNNFYLGPEGGPGLCFLWGNGANKRQEEPAVSGYAAYTFQYNFTQIIGLRTDVAYERAGGQYTLGSTSQNLRSDNMTIPVLVRATFGKKINYFINAGPYFGVLIREVDKDKDSFSGMTTVTDVTSVYKRFDTGITAGIGIAVPIGNRMSLSFEARNNTGLYNINNAAGNNSIIRNNTTNFIFGFRYEFVTRKAKAKEKKA